MILNTRVVSLVSAILFAALCDGVAEDYFTEEALNRLARVGMPTQEIMQVFGRPVRIRPRSEGYDCWCYMRGDSQSTDRSGIWLQGFDLFVSNAVMLEWHPIYGHQYRLPRNDRIQMQIPDLENRDRPLASQIKSIRVTQTPKSISEQDKAQLLLLSEELLGLTGDKGDVALERGWDFTKCVLAAFPELEKETEQSTSRAISLKRTVLVLRSVLLTNEPPSQLPRSPK